jgi:hypothetical protein
LNFAAGEGRQRRRRDLAKDIRHIPAVVASKVVMGSGLGIEAIPAIVQSMTLDFPQRMERLERVVDGGQRNRGGDAPSRATDIFGGWMGTVSFERAEDRLALGGDPHPRGTTTLDEIMG